MKVKILRQPSRLKSEKSVRYHVQKMQDKPALGRLNPKLNQVHQPDPNLEKQELV